MPLLTANGVVREMQAESGVFVVGKSGETDGAGRSDLGGGTVVLETIGDDLDPTQIANWSPINDTNSGTEVLMSYTTAPQAISFVFYGGARRIRARLESATSPNVWVNIEATPIRVY